MCIERVASINAPSVPKLRNNPLLASVFKLNNAKGNETGLSPDHFPGGAHLASWPPTNSPSICERIVDIQDTPIAILR